MLFSDPEVNNCERELVGSKTIDFLLLHILLCQESYTENHINKKGCASTSKQLGCHIFANRKVKQTKGKVDGLTLLIVLKSSFWVNLEHDIWSTLNITSTISIIIT